MATAAFRMSRRFIWFFPQRLWRCREGRRPVDGTIRAIPDRSASHATAVCTGWPEDCRAGPPASTAARASGPHHERAGSEPEVSLSHPVVVQELAAGPRKLDTAILQHV